MQKFQIQFFLISILILLVTSCSRGITEGLIEYKTAKTKIENTYFSNLDRDYVYKMNLEIYKHSIGGILIVKKIGTDHHRIVYTSEFGSKIFDFEFNEEEVSINFILSELDKKYILNTLLEDLKVLVEQEVLINQAFNGLKDVYYETLSDGKANYYVFSQDSEQLVKIICMDNRKENVSIYFDKIDDRLARKIRIEHENIKLKISLSLIN